MAEYPGDFARLSREITFSAIYKPWTAFKRLVGPPLRRNLRHLLSPSLPKIEVLESRLTHIGSELVEEQASR
ncbi:MAG: hypothetical protein AB7F23_10355 [Phycisphaerae bacterium]